jgi:NAD(P)-dependent dehydrogenase (short-subunit alcohol dehydrogenase family)
MSGRLEGRTGIITGAGSGIGRATALVMAREGAKVVVSDVNEAGGAETVDTIKQAGGEARFIGADVANAEAMEELVARTVKAYGRLDWAFNNAGIAGAIAATADYPIDAWHKVIDINLNGVWYGMRAQIPAMLKSGGGAIVNTASDAGLIGLRRASAYVAAKHAVVGMTKTAALEYAKRNIRVNTVCPGFTRTPIMDPSLERDPSLAERFAHAAPMGRMGKPEEIGETVAWLCSDAASFITGIAVPVDGGLYAD